MTPQLAGAGNNPAGKVAAKERGPRPQEVPLTLRIVLRDFFSSQVAAGGRGLEFFPGSVVVKESRSVTCLVFPVLCERMHREH